MVNVGVLRSPPPVSTISLNGGAYDNTGGTLTADTGSSIRLNNSVSVTGGILSSNGTGEIAVAANINAGLANVTITAGSLFNVRKQRPSQPLRYHHQRRQFHHLTVLGNVTRSIAIFGNTEFAGYRHLHPRQRHA